jgi:MoaA/NifB/PqqE/SkfB family radical SAM enzyme
LTYACNLRCGFCYTDSPRRTLQRSVDLPDEEWRRIAAEALDLGIIEAVVTGGEPLLRKALALELIETLASRGVGVTLNTNGWFVDDEVAGHLAPFRSVTVYLSIDGARPGLHDAARGVPGSWRRAVEGADRLLAAGVDVCVIHVVTPDNVGALEEFLEQMWTLGVPRTTITPVVETGAAARNGGWRVGSRELRNAVARFERRRGTAMQIHVRPANAEGIAYQGSQAPASMLVRPNGDARTDSLRPFSFGNAARDGVAGCWQAIRDSWRDERIERWAAAHRGPRDLPRSDRVAYLDDELPVTGGDGGIEPSGGRDAQVPAPAPLEPIEPAADLALARQKVLELALARRYRLAPARRSDDPDGRLVLRVADGRYIRLNEASATGLDALGDGTPGDAALALEARYEIGAERATDDAIAVTRELSRQGLLVAAGADEPT